MYLGVAEINLWGFIAVSYTYYTIMDHTVWKSLLELQPPVEISDFAFLVLNQPILCDPQIVKSLWNKASISAISDGGANQWLDFLNINEVGDLKPPDFISGDFDSIFPTTRTFFENQGINFIFTPDQDETDFTKALKCIGEANEARKLKLRVIFVLCENSGRLDQIFGNVNTLHRSKEFLQNIPVIILSKHNLTWVLHPGNHIIHVTDEFIENQYSCGLIPLCGPTVLTTSGLKWNLNNTILQIGGVISTSNTYISKEVSVTCNKDVIWTTEYC